MNIDPTKIGGVFRVNSPPKIAVDTPDKNNLIFNQVLDSAVNSMKNIENTYFKAVDIAQLAQLQLLQGLFSIDEEQTGDSFFTDVQKFDLLPKIASQQSQILDKYYSVQQPLLIASEPKGRGEIEKMIDQVAKKVNLAPELIHSVVSAESAYDPAAVSQVGAQGLMQLMPETADELGVQDSFDPMQNLLGGSRYLKQLMVKYAGDLDSALAAYNWGQGNVDRKGLEQMPQETRNYLAKVKSNLTGAA